MPELPEVEYARRRLLTWLKRSLVVEAHAENSRIFRGASRAEFAKLRGKVKRIDRVGKQLLLVFDNGAVLSHLGMTGKWVLRDSKDERFSRAYFRLANGSFVHYRDPRMFGRLIPTQDTEIANLGPDALGITAKQLRAAIGKSKTPIKLLLMDQARIAGIGNIQAAEALWRAKINPKAREVDYGKLAKAINATLRFTLKVQGGDEIQYVEEAKSENPFKIYGRKGEPCPRCKTPIATLVQGGRTTFFCPKCQA